MKSVLKILFLLLLALHVNAEPNFPKLTGRVVDGANILSAETKQSLENMLANLETNSSNQLVVVTLKSLQGYDIADFGYRLGRAWGIGQKKKNNGVLLIVAPNERKVRIEVGYGLEGILTDAISSVIIQNRIIPYFKKGDFDKGVLEGVKAIIGTIKGTYKPEKHEREKIGSVVPQLFFGFFFLMIVLQKAVSQKFGNIISKLIPSSFFGLFAYVISASILIGLGIWVGLFLLFLYFGAFESSGGSDGGSWSSTGGFYGGSGGFDSGFGGGFSGGGGGFGGGGASGGW